MVVMHSTFNLKPGVSADDFKMAFQAFCAHLREQNLLEQWRLMTHEPHDGYNADAPLGKHYLMTEFANTAAAQRCWDYVALDEEPIRTLHYEVRSRITDSSFYLSRDL